jgi:hypothetical protein
MQQRENVVLLELLAAVKEIEFYYEGQAGDVSAKRFGQLHSRGARSAGGEQIIDDDYALAGTDCVFVHF